MALTSTILGSSVPGNLRRARIVVTGDTSYPNPAGYTITAALFGFQYLAHAVLIGPNQVNGTVVGDASFNEATNALHFVAPSGSEVANATNVSAISFNMEGYGN